MARSSAFFAVVVAVLLIGGTHAQIHDQCMNYFGGLGGENGIVPLVPSCKQGLKGFRACCSEVKVLVGKAPEGCLCDAAVWNELVQKVEDAHINGLTRDTLNTFANLCGIPHSGGNGCRRLARSNARRNGRRSSVRSTTRSSVRSNRD